MAVPNSDPIQSAPPSSLGLADLRQVIRRNRGLLLATTTAVLAVTTLATVLLPPVYESTASIRIQTQDSKSGLLGEIGALAGGVGLGGLGNDEVGTEMGIIRSRRITEPVAESLGLHVRLQEPDRLRSEVLDVRSAPPEAVPGRYALLRQSDGSYRLRADRVRRSSGRYTSNPAEVRALVGPEQRVEIGTPFRIGGMEMELPDALRADPPEEIRFRVDPFLEVIEKLREDQLQVARMEGSNLVSLEYRNSDPELAAAAVNAITDHFVDYKLRTSSSDSRTREEVLSGEVEAYEVRLAQLEARLREFQEREQLVAPEEQANQQVKRIAALQAERDALEVERTSLAALLAELADRSPASDGPSPYRKLATFPSFISNGAIQDILQSLVELENDRAELLVRRTPDNADVMALTNRIQELEGQLYRLGRDYSSNLTGRIASADRVLAQFSQELRTMPAREIQFARLMREQELLSEVYLLLQKQLKQEQVQGEMAQGTGEVRVIDYGVVPEEPVFPKPAVNLLLGLAMGLMVGLMVVIGRESLNTTVRSAAEARDAAPGLPVLGSIPRLRSALAADGAAAGGRTRLRQIATFPYRIISPESVVPARERLVARWSPHHPAAEAFRSLRTTIPFASGGARPRVVMITSALPSEGKSTIAANLAVSLAQGGSRTLLVDTDLRHGALHAMLGVRREPGLAAVLRGVLSAAEAIQQVPAGEHGAVLDVLASGAPAREAVEMLGGEPLERTLEAVKAEYDWIILDTPALQPVTDAALIGRLADTTLVVIRAGVTEPETLRTAIEQLRRLDASVGGIVLNEAYEVPSRFASYDVLHPQAERTAGAGEPSRG